MEEVKIIATQNKFDATIKSSETFIKGPQGEKGDKGDKGETGETGPQGEKGDKGDKGETGETGPQGIQGEKGDPFTYADFTAEQLEALKGPKGDKGDTGIQGIQGEKGISGEDGATFIPSLDEDGNLSWSNNKGLDNPSSVNIKGPQGEKGDKGDKGDTGITKLIGTEENVINANDIKEPGIYLIEGNRINFPIDDTNLKQLIYVSYGENTATILPTPNIIIQSMLVNNGLYTREIYETFGIPDPTYTYGDWELQSSGGTGSKEIAYEGDTLEGTEAIMIEDSDFEGLDFENDLLERVVTINNGYEKYSDGTLKCWGKKSLGSVAISNAFGTLFVSAAQVFDDFPIAFIEAPVVTKWVNNSGASCWIINGLPAVSETNAGGINLVGVVSGTASDVVIQYMAVGKWK